MREDAKVNLTTGYGGGLTLSYDSENHLVSAGSVSYTYDLLGRRVSRTYNGVTTSYVWDGWHIIAEYENGSLTKKYIYGPGMDNPAVMINASGSSQGRYYYYADALGSVRLITNSSGSPVESYTYDVYGKPRVMSYAGVDGNWHNRFRPLSQYNDGFGLAVYAKSDPVNIEDGWGLSLCNPANPSCSVGPGFPRQDPNPGIGTGDFIGHYFLGNGTPFYFDSSYVDAFFDGPGSRFYQFVKFLIRQAIGSSDISCDNPKIKIKGSYTDTVVTDSGINRYHDVSDPFYSLGSTTAYSKYTCDVKAKCKCCKGAGLKVTEKYGVCRVVLGIKDDFTNPFDIGGPFEYGHDIGQPYKIRGNTVKKFDYTKEYGCE